MPETHFTIEWPDGQRESCYSPSSVVRDYFQTGQRYPLADFLARSKTALLHASDRVREKYGMPCSQALGQLSQIERTGRRFAEMPEAGVTLLSFQG